MADFSRSSLPPFRNNLYRPASVYGGAGGIGVKASPGRANIRAEHGKDMSMDGAGNIFSEKETMQVLNGRLSAYLEAVRSLKKANEELRSKIKNFQEEGHHLEQDLSPYEKKLSALLQKAADIKQENNKLNVAIRSETLATEDIKDKLDIEMSIRKVVEADIHVCRKHIDDSMLNRMHLESQIESLRQELLYLQKNHEEDVAILIKQIEESTVNVEVKSPEGQDLEKMMEKIRNEYEAMMKKNKEEVQNVYLHKIAAFKRENDEKDSKLSSFKSKIMNSHKECHSLEIQYANAQSLRAALEAKLEDTELYYRMEQDKINRVIAQLENELRRLKSSMQQKIQECHTLSTEIDMYKSLLD